MLTMVKKNRLTIDRLVELLGEKPAEIFSLKGRGHLGPGFKADMVAVDLKTKFKIEAETFNSKAKFSPYEGWEVQGKPVKTFINGHLVMDAGKIVAKPGSGAVIRREAR
jgi:dihydroorotase-like cyclic amidohydrolase